MEIDYAAFVLLPIAQILCHASAPPSQESILMHCGSKSIADLFTLTASLNLSHSNPEFSALFFFCNFSVLSHSYVSFCNRPSPCQAALSLANRKGNPAHPSWKPPGESVYNWNKKFCQNPEFAGFLLAVTKRMHCWLAIMSPPGNTHRQLQHVQQIFLDFLCFLKISLKLDDIYWLQSKNLI